MEITPEPDWQVLYNDLLKHKGTAIIVGATDSGKSTLSKYLIKNLTSANLSVCLIDSDIGQSSLCLPGTISMKIFHDERDTDNFRCEKFSFIGVINPAKRISLILDTVKRITENCRKDSDVTLIDTSGLIDGTVGEALKIGKISAVRPEHIVALQRAEELEHILKLIVNLKIHRINPSDNAKTRTFATRAQYRKKKVDSFSYSMKSPMSALAKYSSNFVFLY